MKTIVQDKYGTPDALQLQDMDRPVPKEDEVLVRVRAAGINPYDWHLMTGLPYIARLLGRTIAPEKAAHPAGAPRSAGR